MFKPYEGPLNQKKMSETERIAYESFNGIKARSKKLGLPAPTFGPREFIGWWLKELKTFKGTIPTCGRKDHLKGYTWDNFEMQDMADNSREMNQRTKAVFREKTKGTKVIAIDKTTGKTAHSFNSIRETAKFFNVSQRLIQFLVRGKYRGSRTITFEIRGAA